MALIVHLVAVKAEFLARRRFLLPEEHANTLQEQRGRLNSSLEMETKGVFDIKEDQPLGLAVGRRGAGCQSRRLSYPHAGGVREMDSRDRSADERRRWQSASGGDENPPSQDGRRQRYIFNNEASLRAALNKVYF